MCYIPVEIDNFSQHIDKHVFPPMDVECTHCGALRFAAEKASLCCSNGKVDLEPLTIPPELASLSSDKKLKRHARGYNQAFAISTIGGIKQDRTVNNGETQTYRVCGKAYHRYGSLFPTEGKQPVHAQMYFYSAQEQDDLRKRVLSNLNKPLLTQIRLILERHNPYVQKFKQIGTGEHGRHEDYKLIFHHFDDKIYNAPSVNEIGAIQDTNTAHQKLDVVMEARSDGKLHYVDDLSSCYDSIQYLLLHPYGQQGWTSTLPMTCRQFYAFHAFARQRNKNNNPLTLFGPLVQQYWVDMGMKLERLRLKYITLHKDKFRVADKPTVDSAINNNNDVAGVKLPSSVTGAPRYFHEKLKDAIKICEKHGGPHVFITITCNPQWEEIRRELQSGQSPFHRPELLVRVFKIKLDEIINDIYDENLFGVAAFRVHVIEFQKRMLPHAHLIVGLKDGESLTSFNRNFIDKYIYAEIPDAEKHPQLYKTIVKHNLHYPCDKYKDASCLKDGMCKAHFPKQFNSTTYQDEEGWVHYRRRSPQEGGNIAIKRSKGKQVAYTNANVTPYNPYLSLKYDCHINVEIVNTIQPVKYLFVYFCKGPTMASASLKDENDEVKKYLSGRFMTACEALWRILAFPLMERSTPVLALPVHLPNYQSTVFDECTHPSKILINPKTKLTEFFKFCGKYKKLNILYEDITLHATWATVKENGNAIKCLKTGFIQKHWKLRERTTNQLGRIQPVPMRDKEKFYLRLLLKNVLSPKSFKDLRTHEGKAFETFQEAAKSRGLLQHDDQIHELLKEAATFQMPQQFCDTFASLLMFAHISEPKRLFEQNLHHFSTAPPHRQRNAAAWLINEVLQAHGYHISRFIEGVHPTQYNASTSTLLPTTKYYTESITNRNKLNESQQTVYEAIFLKLLQQCQSSYYLDRAIENENVFFLDSPAGYGKTFLLNAILGTCIDGRLGHTDGGTLPHFLPVQIATAAVATTNQAAELLINGGTAHSFFKLPLNLFEGSYCNISINSDKARCLKDLKLLIFDEIGSAHRYMIEAIDRTLRDITNINEVFGGIVVLFCGCFRQILPIIPKATKPEILAASVKASPIWRTVKTYKLSENLRCIDQSFATQLLKIGTGKPQEDTYPIYLNKAIHITSQPKKIVKDIYDKRIINSPCLSTLANYYANRIILAVLNTTCMKVNHSILQSIRGNEIIFKSNDSVDSFRKKIPQEKLNAFNPPSLPPHILRIKIGMPVMVLRTINKVRGLINGARGIVTGVRPNCVQIQLVTGPFKGTYANVFRITLYSDLFDGIPAMKRYQFPIKAGWCITINKAQGTTMDYVGIMLNDSEVFAHGQLYVALSRAKDPRRIHVCLSKEKVKKRETQNVVYHHAIL